MRRPAAAAARSAPLSAPPAKDPPAPQTAPSGRVVTFLIWAGAALLVTAGAVQVLSPPRIPADFGTVPTAPAPAGVLTVAGADVVTPTAAGRGEPSPAVAPPRTARAPGKVAPVALDLQGFPSVPVVPVGVTRGHLDVPEPVRTLGWWTDGAGMDAAAGSIVVTGHVDSERQGTGYLAALRDIASGQRVTVTGADGSRSTFVITGRRAYRKAQGLPATVFDQGVQRRLVLITCTGAFDPQAGRYEDNLVIYAVPAEAGTG